MSKILITGNGFDLFHGLPTKYGHFMAVMMTVEDYNFNKNISFEELFGKIFKKKFSNEYDLILENFNAENVFFEDKKIDEIKILLKNNSWYQHFKSASEIKTWIDFEIEIENTLVDISKIFKFIKENLTGNPNFYNKRLIKSNKNFDSFGFIERVQDSIYVFIKNEYLDTNKFDFNEDKLLSEMVNSLEDFIFIFNEYLINVVDVFYQEVKSKKQIPFNLIDKIYTFNYTPTLEKIYKVDSSKIAYLHGNVIKNNIVLGISEINQNIRNNNIFGFTKYYQKIRKSSNEKFIEIPNKERNNLSQTIFYLIGHSLDESDKEYVIDLFKFLKMDYNKFSKICIFYYNEDDYNTKLNNLFKINDIDKDVILEMHKNNRLYFEKLTIENIIKNFNIPIQKQRQLIT